MIKVWASRFSSFRASGLGLTVFYCIGSREFRVGGLDSKGPDI